MIKAVAEMSEFSKKRPGRGMGIAFADYHGTYTAGVAEVSVDEKTGKITVHKPAIVRKASAALRSLTEEQRRVMIAEAAYYMAERRGFESGHELEDWLLAESQLEAPIRGGDSPP